MSFTQKLLAFIGVGLLTSLHAFAQINQVRVVNNSKSAIYIHVGGFAPSVKIPEGKSKIFSYPFTATAPGQSKKHHASLLIATAGGRWVTTPNGLTYLSRPAMSICLDYANTDNKNKTGNRLWTVKKAVGFSPNCKVKAYKQAWYRNQNST